VENIPGHVYVFTALSFNKNQGGKQRKWWMEKPRRQTKQRKWWMEIPKAHESN